MLIQAKPLDLPGVSRQLVPVCGGEMAVFDPAGDSPAGVPLLVWAHGWGQSHAPLLPLAEAMRRSARSKLLDLPGFGAAQPPPQPWSTSDYADAAAEWLGGIAGRPRVWVAYSFGCRVGLQLAARHPELIDGLFLIAAPGLPRRRSAMEHARLLARRWVFRAARSLTPEGPARERLRERFGSPDYRNASPLLRQILVKAVSENLGAAATAVRCPTMLVYGERDDDASPDIGERYQRMIPQSRLVVLRGFGHLDIVGEGRHQIVQLLTEFLEQFR